MLPVPAAAAAADTIIDLGTLGGYAATAEAVSGKIVVGGSLVAGNLVSHAFAYDLGAVSPSMIDLGTLPGGSLSDATGVSGNIVIGTSSTATATHAFAYDLGAASPSMIDLGTLPGDDTSIPNAVSGSIVVGVSYNGEFLPQVAHAFAYDLAAASPAMIDLGTLSGDNNSGAGGVSGSVIVGRSYSSQSLPFVGHAFAYDLAAAAPSMIDLGAISGGTNSGASAVSGTVVVGNSSTAAGYFVTHAFAYDLGTASPAMLDLGTLGGTTSTARDVSGSVVIGNSLTTGFDSHAFAYDLGAPSPSMVDLGTLGGRTSQANDVSGDIVVGDSNYLASFTNTHAFAYDLGAASPAMRDLGTLPGDTDSNAWAVSGHIAVGKSCHCGGTISQHAVAWQLGDTGGATPVGHDVTVVPTYAGGTSPVDLTFQDVTAAGITSLTTSTSAPALPGGFSIGSPPVYYDLQTTATYSGSIMVCISYAGGPAPTSLLHYDSGVGAWVNLPSTLDTADQKICGTTNSLSPFAVATMTFSYPTSGAFVIGDRSAIVGATVTWWSPKWSSQNNLSGGSAPSAFKGFAGALSSTPPVAGGMWGTSGGQASNPPTTVPTYMAVIVTGSATKSGSTISGTDARIAVVQVYPGYNPVAGSPGTGRLLGFLP